MRKPNKMIKELDWRTPRFKKITEIIKKYKKFEAEKVVKKLEAELKETFNNLYLKAFEEQNSSEERKKERGKIIRQIKEIELKDRLKLLSGIIANLEASEDEDEIAQVEAQYAQVLTKLAILQRAKS
jgi:hypothetical protein